MTYKLALHWLPFQVPGIIGSALGLASPMSVYCDWVRSKVGSATTISVWQHTKLSVQIRPWDTLACCWDIKQPTNCLEQEWDLMCSYLHNGIHRTRLLTEATVDTLCHVNVIASCASTAVSTRLSFNGDSLWITTIKYTAHINTVIRQSALTVCTCLILPILIVCEPKHKSFA